MTPNRVATAYYGAFSIEIRVSMVSGTVRPLSGITKNRECHKKSSICSALDSKLKKIGSKESTGMKF